MSKKILQAGINSNLTDSAVIVKGAILLGSAGLALLLCSNDKKKSKKKKDGFLAKTKKLNSTANALCQSFYLYDIKKNGERDGFPVKMETAEIIEI